MGEEKEKKKKKKKDKKKEEEAPTPPPAEDAAAGSVKEGSKKKSSKKGSQASQPAASEGPLSLFTVEQLESYKAGFNFLDQDKDGIITKNDLFRAYDIIGKLASEKELESLLCESENPITFTQFVTMFAERMEGKADPDELIIEALNKFDMGGGVIDTLNLEQMLQGVGDGLTDKEVADIFPDIPRTGETVRGVQNICLKGLIGMICSKDEEPPSEYETEAEDAAAS